jgi:sulfhydrogenase subunit delta
MVKPTVGFYDLTGCNGCLLSFVFNEAELLDIAKHVDIKSFRFVKEVKEDKPLDIAFVEGLVASNKDVESVKEIRARAKVLVALGACACTGCIPAMKNFTDPSKYSYLTYSKIKETTDVQPVPINMHIQVDYYIPGCPPDKKQILEFIKDVLLGKKPQDYDRPVCFECRLNENRCLLDDNKMCLGPITRGGCNSICTNGKLECWGCRGPMPDANLPLIAKLLEQKGYSKEQVKLRMRTFAALMMEKLPEQKLIIVKKKAEKKTKKTAKKIKKAKPKKAVKKVKKTAKKIKKVKIKKQAKKVRKIAVKKKIPAKPKSANTTTKKKAVKKPAKKSFLSMIKRLGK